MSRPIRGTGGINAESKRLQMLKTHHNASSNPTEMPSSSFGPLLHRVGARGSDPDSETFMIVKPRMPCNLQARCNLDKGNQVAWHNLLNTHTVGGGGGL